ncbi:hypothetical protein M0802_011808 [Mischocyttarus mexicanus]|nr:hypothetical protein M0802_011808 [Mischocyttarus mexicanus]
MKETENVRRSRVKVFLLHAHTTLNSVEKFHHSHHRGYPQQQKYATSNCHGRLACCQCNDRFRFQTQLEKLWISSTRRSVKDWNDEERGRGGWPHCFAVVPLETITEDNSSRTLPEGNRQGGSGSGSDGGGCGEGKEGRNAFTRAYFGAENLVHSSDTLDQKVPTTTTQHQQQEQQQQEERNQ